MEEGSWVTTTAGEEVSAGKVTGNKEKHLAFKIGGKSKRGTSGWLDGKKERRKGLARPGEWGRRTDRRGKRNPNFRTWYFCGLTREKRVLGKSVRRVGGGKGPEKMTHNIRARISHKMSSKRVEYIGRKGFLCGQSAE